MGQGATFNPQTRNFQLNEAGGTGPKTMEYDNERDGGSSIAKDMLQALNEFASQKEVQDALGLSVPSQEEVQGASDPGQAGIQNQMQGGMPDMQQMMQMAASQGGGQPQQQESALDPIQSYMDPRYQESVDKSRELMDNYPTVETKEDFKKSQGYDKDPSWWRQILGSAAYGGPGEYDEARQGKIQREYAESTQEDQQAQAGVDRELAFQKETRGEPTQLIDIEFGGRMYQGLDANLIGYIMPAMARLQEFEAEQKNRVTLSEVLEGLPGAEKLNIPNLNVTLHEAMEYVNFMGLAEAEGARDIEELYVRELEKQARGETPNAKIMEMGERWYQASISSGTNKVDPRQLWLGGKINDQQYGDLIHREEQIKSRATASVQVPLEPKFDREVAASINATAALKGEGPLLADAEMIGMGDTGGGGPNESEWTHLARNRQYADLLGKEETTNQAALREITAIDFSGFYMKTADEVDADGKVTKDGVGKFIKPRKVATRERLGPAIVEDMDRQGFKQQEIKDFLSTYLPWEFAKYANKLSDDAYRAQVELGASGLTRPGRSRTTAENRESLLQSATPPDRAVPGEDPLVHSSTPSPVGARGADPTGRPVAGVSMIDPATGALVPVGGSDGPYAGPLQQSHGEEKTSPRVKSGNNRKGIEGQFDMR